MRPSSSSTDGLPDEPRPSASERVPDSVAPSQATSGADPPGTELAVTATDPVETPEPTYLPPLDGPQQADGPLPSLAGRYQIEETIGQGGMGVVARVRDTAFQRDLALQALRA